MNNHLEIERKFLISYPDVSFLDGLDNISKVYIEQTYTENHIRIRKWVENGKTIYIKTIKEKINDIVRIERENIISREEYSFLMKSADKSRRTIIKTRYRYPYKDKIIEIDIFPFWSDRAFCEVELEYENESFSLPPFIKVIKEVTEDNRYNNSSIAKEIPNDKI